MDPVAPQAANLLSAVQALFVRQGAVIEGSPLAALLGQDVEMLFQALAPGGVKLQLPSGQTVTAQGELPYPAGTQLRVRILPAATGETGLRLQLQEARPPAPTPLLSPLTQSEAATLATRLVQEAPPPELAPLTRLLAVLADIPPAARAVPSSEQLQSALRELPGTLLSSLGRALDTGGMASLQELATSLQGFLQEPRKAMPGLLPENRLSDTTTAGDADQSLEILAQQVVVRFQARLAQHPEIPAGDRDPLANWVRTLLHKVMEERPSLPRPPAAPPDARPEAGVRSGRAPVPDALIPPKLMAVLQSTTGSKAELPEAWEAWIRGAVTTLSDPAAAPREAAFHALQAKEGTAFFELPLPWAQASPLQLWVEADASEERQGGGERTKRVLLGLNFSNLGETRLGMAQGSFGLQIRIWTERAEALEQERTRMEAELKELGKPVDLKIYTLTYGPDGTIPSLRALVVGPSLSALG